MATEDVAAVAKGGMWLPGRGGCRSRGGGGVWLSGAGSGCHGRGLSYQGRGLVARGGVWSPGSWTGLLGAGRGCRGAERGYSGRGLVARGGARSPGGRGVVVRGRQVSGDAVPRGALWVGEGGSVLQHPTMPRALPPHPSPVPPVWTSTSSWAASGKAPTVSSSKPRTGRWGLGPAAGVLWAWGRDWGGCGPVGLNRLGRLLGGGGLWAWVAPQNPHLCLCVSPPRQGKWWP